MYLLLAVFLLSCNAYNFRVSGGGDTSSLPKDKDKKPESVTVEALHPSTTTPAKQTEDALPAPVVEVPVVDSLPCEPANCSHPMRRDAANPCQCVCMKFRACQETHPHKPNNFGACREKCVCNKSDKTCAARKDGNIYFNSADCSCVKPVTGLLSDFNMRTTSICASEVNLGIARVFTTMATRCDHPYADRKSPSYVSELWILDRTNANYPNYCREFNKLYDNLPWDSSETARFRRTYSANPFRLGLGSVDAALRRRGDFAAAWHEHIRFYSWFRTHCAKSNDCLNFAFTPDKFVNPLAGQQPNFTSYVMLNDLLNNASHLRKPLMIGGNPSMDGHYGVYYKADKFPASWKELVKDTRDRCRNKHPDYNKGLYNIACQIDGVLTTEGKCIHKIGGTRSGAFNQFWGLPDDEL